MTGRIFRSIFITALVTALALLAVSYFELPVWAPALMAAALITAAGVFAWIAARAIVRPLSSGDRGGAYEELTPLYSRLRHQDQLITRQTDELRRRQREFRAISDNMSEGFAMVDTSGRLLSCNVSAQRLVDAGDGSLGLFRESAEEALRGVHSERSVSFEGHVYQILANPVETSGGISGAVLVSMDITEKAEREAMRHDFSSNVSHELKTPLTSIYGISELMVNGLVRDEDIMGFANTIHAESGRLITLIDDIMRLSQLDDSVHTEREDTDMYSIAGDVIRRLRPAAEKRGVTLKLTGVPRTVSGVPSILDEMIYNLCDNAVKYNVDGGSVTVDVGEKDGRTYVTVSDTGIGIPREHQDRVFERFYRVDKSHSKKIGGTGLGLSIVKHGAAYHNADISLKSAPGKGTAVTITF